MGPQQGDPLGPLLFCLPLQTALLKLTSPLAFGFLDDISLGGPAASVAADMASLEVDCADLGLALNRSKCELMAKDLHHVTNDPFAQFARVDEGVDLLVRRPALPRTGSPRLARRKGEQAEQSSQQTCLNSAPGRSPHPAQLSGSTKIAPPPQMRTMRTCAGYPTLDVYDKGLRKGLEDILNINLTGTQCHNLPSP